MIGRVYLEKGRPVTVLVRWAGLRIGDVELSGLLRVRWPDRAPRGGPRNVLIRREDGTKVVRPFRGLRRASEERADG